MFFENDGHFGRHLQFLKKLQRDSPGLLLCCPTDFSGPILKISACYETGAYLKQKSIGQSKQSGGYQWRIQGGQTRPWPPIEIRNGVWSPLRDRKSNVSIVILLKSKEFGPPYRCRLRICPPYGKIPYIKHKKGR